MPLVTVGVREQTASESLLHRGLLCALAMLRRDFDSYSERFHIAYGIAMRAGAPTLPAARRALQSHDAVFGVFRVAESMVLEGMRDFILFLAGPRNTRAVFKINIRTAGEMLAR